MFGQMTTPVIPDGLAYYYGTQLKYVGIEINTTINDANLAYTTGLPLRDRWEEVISGEVTFHCRGQGPMQGAPGVGGS